MYVVKGIINQLRGVVDYRIAQFLVEEIIGDFGEQYKSHQIITCHHITLIKNISTGTNYYNSPCEDGWHCCSNFLNR